MIKSFPGPGTKLRMLSREQEGMNAELQGTIGVHNPKEDKPEDLFYVRLESDGELIILRRDELEEIGELREPVTLHTGL